MAVKTIRIVKASSLDREGHLANRMSELTAAGFKVLFDDLLPDPSWPYCAGSVGDRNNALTSALLEETSDAVMWARGGYGASELLELVPWSAIKQARPKPIIGFSDVSAAQSALYVMTGRSSIHGPMPATSTWKKNGSTDVDTLISYLKGEISSHGFAVEGPSEKIEGLVFGGCLSVLTSLIGTPYLPKSLAGHILLFEDIGENPGRIIRMLNQWRQSGMFAGVKALVFGSFTDLGANLSDSDPMLFSELRRRINLPIYTTPHFGHVSPNQPFVIGSHGKLDGGTFEWSTKNASTIS